ncbi:sodium- and chloride-dependent betaine transporter-like [Mauremys mutica]|uniref:sodium- and chloride-dependent betaine transporter-like n=1 Tax=Mauremys mutica TaxID=74926 RepID=UPI001D152406|nr:sodium- and chloride-dependent betaine transporter-like [Mauremys mutica]
MTAIVDMYPKILQKKGRRELLILAIAVICYLLGLMLVTEGGMYVFQLFDYYAASGTCRLFLAIFEIICVGWVYGDLPIFTDQVHPPQIQQLVRVPSVGYALGWLMALSSMICIPLYVICILLKTRGSLKKRLKQLTSLAEDLPQPKKHGARVSEPLESPKAEYRISSPSATEVLITTEKETDL